MPVVAIVLAVSAACTDPGNENAPTFADDVAEIVYASCTPCHRPGEPTPFSLLDYDDVYKRRRQIAEVTGMRLMPPWLPSHADFVGDRRLSDQQIAVLQQWVTAGAPRGEIAAEPPCPEFSSGWQLRDPDLIVTVTEELTVPASGPDIFRNVVIPVEIDAPRFVEAVEVRPGNAAAHHAVLAIDRTPLSHERAAADPEPGFAGMDMGNARPPDGNFIGWTPGKQTRPSSEGMAWTLIPGDDLVLQLHLTPTGKLETLRPRIGLYFTDVPPSVVSYPLGMFVEEIDLPAGAADVVLRDHFVTPVPIDVHSVYPHAHYLCRSMEVWATQPDGARVDLFRIDRWDFDWQDDYTYRKPLSLPAGTRIEFEYRYDNSEANPANPSSPPRRVRFGDKTTDEMGNLTLQVTTADLDARRVLGEASIRRDLEKVRYRAALLLDLTKILRETGRNDEALRTVAIVRQQEPENADALRELGTCLLLAGQAEEAEAAYASCLGLDPAQNMARIQLATIWLQAGRLPEAIDLYDEALKLDPEMAALHNNLATACMASGLLDRAETHYRRTIALDPAFFQAWFNLGRTLAASGRKTEARDALLRAQALRPQDPRTQQALEQLAR